jgi:hypothetical protein
VKPFLRESPFKRPKKIESCIDKNVKSFYYDNKEPIRMAELFPYAHTVNLRNFINYRTLIVVSRISFNWQRGKNIRFTSISIKANLFYPNVVLVKSVPCAIWNYYVEIPFIILTFLTYKWRLHGIINFEMKTIVPKSLRFSIGSWNE